MRTYRDMFRTPEFASLFGASCAAMTLVALVAAVTGLLLATPGLPLPAMFTVIFAQGPARVMELLPRMPLTGTRS